MSDPAQAKPPAQANPNAANNAKRKRLLTYLAVAVAVGAVGYGVYYLAYASHYVSTDNAYVGTDVAQVNALVPGPIATVVVTALAVVLGGSQVLIVNLGIAGLVALALLGLAGAVSFSPHRWRGILSALALLAVAAGTLWVILAIRI